MEKSDKMIEKAMEKVTNDRKSEKIAPCNRRLLRVEEAAKANKTPPILESHQF